MVGVENVWHEFIFDEQGINSNPIGFANEWVNKTNKNQWVPMVGVENVWHDFIFDEKGISLNQILIQIR